MVSRCVWHRYTLLYAGITAEEWCRSSAEHRISRRVWCWLGPCFPRFPSVPVICHCVTSKRRGLKWPFSYANRVYGSEIQAGHDGEGCLWSTNLELPLERLEGWGRGAGSLNTWGWNHLKALCLETRLGWLEDCNCSLEPHYVPSSCGLAWCGADSEGSWISCMAAQGSKLKYSREEMETASHVWPSLRSPMVCLPHTLLVEATQVCPDPRGG